MAIESSNGIVTPDGFDDVKYTQDLGAMAVTIDDALERRANHWIGTSTERTAFTVDAPEGTFWTDNNGDRYTWTKRGSSWVRVWPTDATNVLRIGGYDISNSNVFFNARNLMSDNTTRALSLQLINSTSYTTGGSYLTNFIDGSATSNLRFSHDGKISILSAGPNQSAPRLWRPQIFAIQTGSISVSSSAGVTHAETVTLSPGRFTTVPRISLTPVSGQPENIRWSLSSLSADSFTFNVHRLNNGTTNFHWMAIQV